MNIHDDLIVKLFFTDKKKINNSNNIKFKKNTRYENIRLYLKTRYSDSESERETLYRILYGIEVRPTCPICNGKVKFNGRNDIMFLSHCSNKCKKLDEDVNRKWKESCGEKGTNREKAKKTMLEKYGFENPYQIPEIIEYVKSVNKEKQQESLLKRKNTCLERYGVENYTQTTTFIEKCKQTSIKKYGTEFPIQSDIVKQKYDWDIITKKINSTKKEHGTFNTSKDEDTAHELIRTKYNDVRRQYKSDKYPFLCDFYIPSLDMYIECQFGWQHGKHPFNENDINDVNELNRMKSKHTKYYDNVIYNWSVRDVHKRNVAKTNKLNYVEFWKLKDVYEWLSLEYKS